MRKNRINPNAAATLKSRVQDFKKSEDAVLEAIDRLSEPDRSNVPALVASSDRASLHAVEGAEREWEDNAKRLMGDEERDLRSYGDDLNFARWFTAFARGDMEEARRADPQWARTLTTAAGGDGLVAPGYFANLVFLKEHSSARLSSMMYQVTTTDASVRVPYEKTVPTALTVAEGGDMTSGQTEPDIEALSVAPIKLGQVVTVTRELVDDSPLSVTSALAGRVAHAIGEKEDDLWLNSADGGAVDFGDAGGLIAGGTASSDTWDDDAETLATVVSKLYEMPRDVLPRCRWCINVAAAEHLSTTVDLDGTNKSDRPIMLPANDPAGFMLDSFSGIGGASSWGSLAGLPVYVFKTGTGGIAANKAVLFDPSAVARVSRQELHFEVDRGSGFLTDVTRLHVSRRVGGAIMQATHVRVFPDA